MPKDKKEVEDEEICDWQSCYRDYDLSPLDPIKPSIHILVDDVMMKILNYLPLGEVTRCEIVCRRWQILVKVIFESIMHLNVIGPEYIIKNNRIAKLGQALEYFELKHAPYLWSNDLMALKSCKKLKCFSTNRCFKFNEKLFSKLVSFWPCLVNIDVSWSTIKGNCFNLLPKGLKELKINYCFDIHKENMNNMCKMCSNLEVLEIEHFEADKEFLDHLGHNCTNLRRLKLKTALFVDFSDQIQNFTKLVSLKLVGNKFELANIAGYINNLENLHIKLYSKTINWMNFGKFKDLKKLFLNRNPFRNQELMSLEKCRNLENVTIWSCDRADEVGQETIIKIIKACPKIKYIVCPWVVIDNKFLADINAIMKKRTELIKITLNQDFHRVLNDNKKIVINFIDTSPFDIYRGDDHDCIYDFDDDEKSIKRLVAKYRNDKRYNYYYK